MKYLILGDIHLGRGVSIGKPGVGKELNSRVKDQYVLLNWVLETAIDYKVTDIIITGDVYHDPRPHPTLISLFMAWLKDCEKADICTHIIAGNHDLIRSGSYMMSALDIVKAVEFPNAFVYKTITQINLCSAGQPGIVFTFVPYRDRRMYEAETSQEALDLFKQELIESIDYNVIGEHRRVLVGHMPIEGSIQVGDEIADSLNEIFCPADMFDNNWDAVFMGHIHNPHVIQKKKGRKAHVAHVGSMDRSDFSLAEREQPKSIILLNPNADDKVITVPTRNLRKVEVDVPQGKDSTEYAINAICLFDKQKSLMDAIVRLEIQLSADATNTDRKKVQDYLYTNLGVHYICNYTESRKISAIKFEAEKIFDQSIGTTEAINRYAEAQDMKSDERAEFKKLAHDCHREYEESVDAST